MQQNGIILFDGVCNLCNGFVQRIISADKLDYFRFASLQSDAANDLLKNHPNLKELKSIVLLDKGKIYTKSTAAIKIASQLGFTWKFLQIGYILPAFLRDGIYNIVANNRYKWFGKKDQCMVPTPALKSKFL